ncbi:MAG: hypothetical protein ACI30N_08515, partial [Muribaculaceae bacterium]
FFHGECIGVYYWMLSTAFFASSAPFIYQVRTCRLSLRSILNFIVRPFSALKGQTATAGFSIFIVVGV